MFPTTLPEVRLTDYQMKMLYGLRDPVPRHIRLEFEAYDQWCKRDIQLDRSERYSRAIGWQTAESQRKRVFAYLGYVFEFSDRDMGELSLSAYAEPESIAAFVAYLKARKVGRGHVLGHLSTARKVNNYLCSGTHVARATLSHGTAMDAWLARLESQVSASMPRQAKENLPDAAKVFAWVDGLVAGALQLVLRDRQSDQGFRWMTAWQVQCALIAMLVTGSHMPPCRLSLIKALRHPDYNGPCGDPDCRNPDACLGTHIKVRDPDPEGSGSQAVRVVSFCAPHHKNEARGFAPIRFDFPAGEVTDLLLAHVEHGHALLTAKHRDNSPQLFVRRSGRPFNDSVFSQFWRQLMQDSAAPLDLLPFTAQDARTTFVEDYTSATGMHPDMWDGAAAVMGNTTRQWAASYNPSRQQRLAQAAVNAHRERVDRRRG